MTEFVITRVFRAPRARVWQAWTEPERLQQWWGPKGFTVTRCTVDLRPGGLMHYCLRGSEGGEIWGKFVYREIVKPEKLVVVVSFSDERAGITTHPMSPNWPRQVLSTIEFAEVQGGTQVTVRWIPHEASALERKTFEDGRDSMRQGWTGTLEQLETHLGR